MLGLGSLAGNGWDLLSSPQAPQLTGSGAAAGGAGAGQFPTVGANAQSMTPNGWTSAPPATGTIAQTPLSPNVLGFLIWNQSQQSTGTAGSAGSPARTGTGGTTGTVGTSDPTGTGGTNGSVAWTPLQALFAQLGISESEMQAAVGANGSTATGNTPLNNIRAAGDVAMAPSDPALGTENNGAHWHHHHHAGFADQSQGGGSNPLAGLLGTSAQGASSATTANANGSTTTTITYADGSEVTLTTPAQAAGGSGATTTATTAPPPPSANNFLETLIRLPAQLLTPTAAA